MRLEVPERVQDDAPEVLQMVQDEESEALVVLRTPELQVHAPEPVLPQLSVDERRVSPVAEVALGQRVARSPGPKAASAQVVDVAMRPAVRRPEQRAHTPKARGQPELLPAG